MTRKIIHGAVESSRGSTLGPTLPPAGLALKDPKATASSARGLLALEECTKPWTVIQACYAAQLSDAALDWLIRKEILTREQRGDAGAILRAIDAWLERGARKVNPKLTGKLDVPEVYKAEAHRIAGENRAQVAQAGCCEGRSVFRARSRGCAGAAGKILGTTEV